MSKYIFVYGTLQAGHAPSEIAHAIEKLRLVEKGSIPGILYDLGGFPGAVIHKDESRRIMGQVLELPDDPEILKQLDEYEEFNAEAPEHGQFLRVALPVQLDSGGTLECWVYTCNRDPGNAQIVPGGRFANDSG